MIIQSKSQTGLTCHNNYKIDKLYRSTLPRGLSSLVPVLRSLRGVLVPPSFLYHYSSPHLLTCHFLPPWSPASSASLFCKCLIFTGEIHRAGVYPRVARLPSPPGSILAVSLLDNCISEDYRSDLKNSVVVNMLLNLFQANLLNSSDDVVPLISHLSFYRWINSIKPRW